MPVRDGERHVAEAVDSVLAQTSTDLELVAVDDGSSDGTRAILEERRARDERLRIVDGPSEGFVAAVSVGIASSRSDLIARMDADDVSAPHRLAAQLDFLRANPEVDVVGTSARVVHDDGSASHVIRYPLTDPAVRVALRSSTQLAHGSVLLRRQRLEEVGGYAQELFPAEDYDLWCRLAVAGARFANLDEPLYTYRLSTSGISRRRRDEQERAAKEVGRRYGRTATALPTGRDLRDSLRAVEGEVRAGRADPRAMRRGSRSLLESVPGWLRSRPAFAPVVLASGAAAELRYRRLRPRGTQP
jgi:glycosyltransferase involved in cell wall biosynthesis